jgi:hypothetical protein
VTKEQRTELLNLLAAREVRVTVQIGYVDAANIVRHDGLLILDAPHAAIVLIIDWVQRQKTEGLPGLVCVHMVDWVGPHTRTSGMLVA